MSFWPWETVERDHEIQNPYNPDKIRLLGDYLRLTSDSRVLDVACGKGGPARILASTYGCHITGIELRPAFADEARAQADAAGLGSLIDIRTADASTVELEQESFDAALCLGATFVWGTIADTARALRPAVRGAGFAAIGEPFWREWPLPRAVEDDPDLARRSDYVGLAETVARLEQEGLATTGLIAASEDDWDRYRSLQWRAVEEWLAENADDPRADSFRSAHERFRQSYFRVERGLLGHAIFIGRKR